ncbi:amidohydrolase family protein [Gordonia alkanivorans]|uniref:amidohydrolase family protein n=1 Tax=Gordonia alkanivorans TaxID=84096 RepID=UPI00244967DF|nr:amidohydrolase family protein [Gordonia alkanivorans]MDH3044883.1 amidohydrolase family protein [Gordonia alkanivorans]
MSGTLFRGVSLPEGIRDVVVDDGVITAVGADLESREITGFEIIDGHGGALIPGLHDHHIHLHALAAASASVQCGPPVVTTPDDLAAALDHAPDLDSSGWIRGVGYVETVAGLLDSADLDTLHARRPVRIQHRSGAVWFLNTAAAEAVGLPTADHPGVERDDSGAPTGRVWRADDWLRERIGSSRPPDLTSAGVELTRLGITGITDATPDLSEESLDALVSSHANGAVPQRLHLLGVPLEATPDLPPTVTAGPYKIVLADSDLPDFPTLCERIHSAHSRGRGVAAHCVTREALLLLLAAFDEAGPHPDDRIEHGAIIAADTVEELGRRHIAVVTQPGFIAARGDDYLDRLDAPEVADLYRCASLVEADVPVAMSSDAPYGPVDPWTVIAAAATRLAPDGRIVGIDERVSRRTALEHYLAPLSTPGAAARTVRPGEPADLVLLDGTLDSALQNGPEAVRHTMIRGHIAYRRE